MGFKTSTDSWICNSESSSSLLSNIRLKQKNGTPERSRTPNLLIRSQALYPIELRVHCKDSYKDKPFKEFKQNF